MVARVTCFCFAFSLLAKCAENATAADNSSKEMKAFHDAMQDSLRMDHFLKLVRLFTILEDCPNVSSWVAIFYYFAIIVK